MKYTKLTLLLALLLSAVYGSYYSGEYLEMGVSARNLAMGTSCSALDKTNTAFFANPAGLAYVKNKSLNLMYMDQFGLASYNYLGTSLPVSNQSSIAFNWVRYTVTNIPRRPDLFLEGNYTLEQRKHEVLTQKGTGYGYFSNYDDALFISFAKMNYYDLFLDWMFKNLRIQIPLGANVKILSKNLAGQKGYGIGADIGGRIRFTFGEITSNNLGDLSFGLTLQDFTNTFVYWETKHTDLIQPNIKTSVAFEQPFKFLNSMLAFTYEQNTRFDKNPRYGIEYNLAKLLAFRAGYNFNGINYGCGLYLKIFKVHTNVNYAFLNHVLGNSHRIGLALWF
ncbi:MAG: hypothetical protein JXQ65_06170 [Candidatus Marinimicrobia bacterium]|nr:hypothetical protein [Candidatus Neomarinimicrobiota bacterium]